MGGALVAAGAVLLAGKGLFAKVLYGLGLTFHDVAAIRSVMAVPGFALLAWLHGRNGQPNGRITLDQSDVLLAIFAGVLCYYLGALANFYALTIIDASIERPLLFAYPIFVVLINSAITGKLPSLRVTMALLMTSTGVALVTGALSSTLSSAEWAGMAWVIFCSLSIAIYFLISGELTPRLGSGLFTLIAMTAAAIGFSGHYQWIFGWQNVDLSQTTWLTIVGLVVFSTVLPLFLVAEGVRRIGAARASLISTVGPPATAFMAYFVTGEVLGPTQWLGVIAILVGVFFIESSAVRSA